MMDILDKAKNAINTWEQVRKNPNAVISYLDQGICFMVSVKDFKTWEMLQPEYIHAYMGLILEPTQSNFSLSLFCVDSVTDSKEVYGNEHAYELNLKEIPYLKGLPNNVSFYNFSKSGADTETNLKRSMQWQLYKNQWIHEQADLVQVFKIPFSDLALLFANKDIESLVLVFALKPIVEDIGCNIELIIWGQNASTGVTWEDNPEDFIRPCPPFKGTFMLLDYAL